MSSTRSTCSPSRSCAARSTSSRSPSGSRSAARDIPLIAKIEKPQAAENAEEIIAAAGSGIMVARGDLGIELPIETIPADPEAADPSSPASSQKPAITATQMLASMVSSDRPTRAEVTDVANAIYDGTDAVMLSEETADRRPPGRGGARRWTGSRGRPSPTSPTSDWLCNRVESAGDVAASVAQGAVGATYRLGPQGDRRRDHEQRPHRALVSALRPKVPILAISPRIETVRRLNLLFGVRCAHHDDGGTCASCSTHCAAIARDEGVAAPGDLIAVTAGLPDQELGTNLFEVHRVPE